MRKPYGIHPSLGRFSVGITSFEKLRSSSQNHIDTKYLSDGIFHNTTVPSTVLNYSSSLEFLSDNAEILLMAPKAQMRLSSLLDSMSWSELTSSASTPRDRVRLLSCSLPNSGDWLSAVPLMALGLLFLQPSFGLQFAIVSEFPYSTASLHARNFPGLKIRLAITPSLAQRTETAYRARTDCAMSFQQRR